MMIHKEGYRILLILVLMLVVLNITIFTILSPVPLFKIIILTSSSILFLFFLFFFRYPLRKFEPNDHMIYAPADGKIVVIEELEESEYFKDTRIQISIFMSPFNVHVNHYSMSGVVRYVNYKPGKNLVAYHPKSSVANERSTLVVDNGKGCEVMIRQIAGIIARRIVSYATLNDTVNQGDQLGFIKFGSRVDLFLPVNANIRVNLHQSVKGNKTVIAEI
jgi:phosphatidylserine decarboxylase